MRLFITGTAGFIGFHLARRLLGEGHVVTGYDGMTDYYDPRLKRARSAILARMPGFIPVTGMLEDRAVLERAVEASAPDVVIHLAAQAGVRHSIDNPGAYIASNLVGSWNLLDICRQVRPRHLLLASTSSVYGANAKVPFAETDRSDEPMSLYAATKKAMEAMAHSVAATGQGAHFEIFILSDTTDSTAWIEEEVAFMRLRHRLAGVMQVWYRRRHKNTARKAGNVGDFVTRWGGRYDHMLVLDADSLMEGETIVTLAQMMEDDPRAGIIQTLPLIVNRNTLFARLQQFAGRIYGPLIARGLATWTGRDGNYWGHNAIIRSRAFAEACGLPDLKGRKPFGGHVMSHDFVEAALIRRSGWAVYMVTWLGGSYEESPPSLLDVASRDRRWAQGNIQHTPLVFARGIAWPSRIHFATGIMSYLASPIWLMLLLTGLALALQARFIRPEYFSKDFSLFPAWPRFDSERALQLFVITMGVLMLPKVLGTIETLMRPEIRRKAGGGLAIVGSLFVETLLSAMVAPVMMLIQSRHVIEILSGRDSGWKTQRRDDGGIAVSEVFRHHWQHIAIGLVMGLAAYAISPAILAWMAPTLVGLVLAVPISWASGSMELGLTLRRARLLLIPEETETPAVISAAAAREAEAVAELPEVEDGLTLVVSDRRMRELHEHLLLPPPLRERGKPDLDPVMAEAKIREAVSVEEALRWLTPKERMAVLTDPILLTHLERLRDAADIRPTVVSAGE
ncbi:glucans biosynthesis glucosyltransferase MdoH [Prosthecomicrobium hirschii]|uniref:glucans biosynthesis glucosyltransferase MdoH n=1 Tax=Prosthecodimorpha hirschii TaxID=665126 RepID=UPI00112CC659|nr:glucans biosynthesis glucosyltransferase MdoH [Prosthecomicrobium hirschii]TPQ50495.1 glucans biosynthesis glucosyltransferase MdoH [Prosthecomicrobium hirschii]